MFYSGLPAFIFCYACGAEVYDTSNDSMFSEKKKWNNAKGMIYCQAAELEEMYLMDSELWMTLFRLIVWDPQDGQYLLSGISQFTSGMKRVDFLVPLDRDSAVLGFSYRRKKSITKVKLAPFDRDCPKGINDLFGYPVHSACWQLIQRVIGLDSEQHLEVMMRALRLRLRELFFKPIKAHLESDDGTLDTEEAEEAENEEDGDVAEDPVNIIPVRNLVRKSMWRRKNGIEPRSSSRFIQSCLSDLPFDIKWLILDLLDYNDIFNMQNALYLRIEESYWRLRISKLLIFEIQDIPQEKLDWEFLCPRLEELASSGILYNRHRIARVLQGTKDIFQRLREE